MRSVLSVATCCVLLLYGCHRSEPPAQPAAAPAPAPAAAESTAPGITVKQVVDEGAMCGGFAGVACEQGLYCAMEAGRCSVADDAGTCRKSPEVCTEQYEPVCGCDGKTYGNSCMAARAGAKVDKPGECAKS